MDLSEYRKRLEAFEETLNRELYTFCSGRSASVELTGLYSDNSDLFSRDAFHEIEADIERSPDLFSSRRRTLEKLRGLIMERHLDARAIALTQEISALDTRSVPAAGAEVPVVQLPLLLAREQEAGRRADLNRAYSRALSESEGLRKRRLLELRAGAVELGFDNYLEAYRKVTGIDYTQLVARLEPLLSASEPEYLDALRGSVKPGGGRIHRWDMANWLGTTEPPRIFKPDRLQPDFRETVARMGVQPERPDAISMDLEARPLKQPGGFCLPVRVPFDVRLVLLPTGGYADFAVLFHEAGHAHHFAWTSPDLPVEDRVQGDRALAEAYGILFERITRERLWLTEIRNFSNPSHFLRSRSLYQAYELRRHAARLSFEILIHRDPDRSDAPHAFAEIMARYTGVIHDPEYYLSDLEDGFYSADYLRAWIFESMLREHLRTRFGSDWFASRAAGRFFKEIWETGQYYSADELSREIGLGQLDPEVLAGSLTEGLG